VKLVVFCQHAQLEQIRQTGSFPELATASHRPLRLFTEAFDGATAQGSALVFPVFIVDVFPMRSEVFDFSGDGLSDFLGTFGLSLGFEKVLQPVDHERFIAVAQRLNLLGQPIFGPLSSDPLITLVFFAIYCLPLIPQANSGKQWQTVANSGKQWQTVANSGKQWQTGEQAIDSLTCPCRDRYGWWR